MYAFLFIVIGCFGAFILIKLWRRPYPRAPNSLNIWFGPLPTHGENQVRYYLRDALYALAWFVGLVLPILLLIKLGVEIDRRSDTPVSIQVIFVILAGLSYLMFFNIAACLLKAFFMALFRPRRVFKQSLGKFVTERNYR